MKRLHDDATDQLTGQTAEFRELSNRLGNEWAAVCTYLSIPHSVVETMREDNPRNVTGAILASLEHWFAKSTESTDGKLRELKSALGRASRVDLSDTLRVEDGIIGVKASPEFVPAKVNRHKKLRREAVLPPKSTTSKLNVITNKELGTLANNLHATDWKRFAAANGYSAAFISRVEEDHKMSWGRTFAVLSKLKSQLGNHEDTRGYFVDKLKEINSDESVYAFLTPGRITPGTKEI